eukprot:1150751-Pelagomonas_calceolata.AAC.2
MHPGGVKLRQLPMRIHTGNDVSKGLAGQGTAFLILNNTDATTLQYTSTFEIIANMLTTHCTHPVLGFKSGQETAGTSTVPICQEQTMKWVSGGLGAVTHA